MSKRAWLFSGRHLARWVAMVASGRVIAAAAAALWLAVLARRMDSGEFGDLLLLGALSAITPSLADGGVSVELSRQVGEAPRSARSTLHRALVIRLMLGVPAIGLLGVAYLGVSDVRSWPALALMALSTVATMVHQLIVSTCRAVGRRTIEPVADVAPRLAVLAVGVVVSADGIGIVGAALFYAAADVVLMLALIGIATRSFTTRDAIPDAGAFQLRRLAPKGIGLAVWSVQQRFVVWLVALFSGSPELAYFAAAQRVSDAAQLPANAVAVISIPQLASSTPSGRHRTLTQLVVIAVAVGLPVAVVGVLDGRWLAGVTLGNDLRDAGPALSLMLLTVPIAGAAQVLVQVAAAQHAGRQLWVAVVSSVVMAIVSVFMVPARGAVGAAIAMLVGQLVLVAGLAQVRYGDALREPEPALAWTASRSMSS